MAPLSIHSFNESFTPDIFENTPLISQLHDNTMRFGNPKEVVYALIPPESGSSSFYDVGRSREFIPIPNDYRVAYFIGASSWSAIIMSTLITWIFIIIICICIDNKKPLFILSGGYTPSSRRQRQRNTINRSTTEEATITSSHLLSPISTRPSTSYEDEMSYHDNDDLEISTTTAVEKDDFPQSRQFGQDNDNSSIIVTCPTDIQHTADNNHEAPQDNGGIIVHDETENSINFDQSIDDNRSMVLDQYHSESLPPIENIDIERQRLGPRGPIVLVRAIVLFCGIGSIIASLLFLFKGIHLAMVAIDDVDTSLDVSSSMWHT